MKRLGPIVASLVFLGVYTLAVRNYGYSEGFEAGHDLAVVTVVPVWKKLTDDCIDRARAYRERVENARK